MNGTEPWWALGPGTFMSDVIFPLMGMVIFVALIIAEKICDRWMHKRMSRTVQIILYGSLALSVAFFCVHLVARYCNFVQWPPTGQKIEHPYVSPYAHPDKETDLRW